MPIPVKSSLAAGLLSCLLLFAMGAEGAQKMLRGHIPAAVAGLTPDGRVSSGRQLHLAIGVPMRDQAGLEQFLAEVYDPASPHFRQFLTPEELTARFGPTEADYEAVRNFARTNGLVITREHGNRLLLDVSGDAGVIEKAFHISLRTYRHPTEARDFFAPDAEPSVDASLPVVDVSGLDDFSRPHPKIHRVEAAALLSKTVDPKAGSGPGSYFAGTDFRNAYIPGTTLDGTGQMVGLVQFDGFYANDITNYENLISGPPRVTVQPVLLDSFSGTPTTNGNIETSLDIEMAIAMAPNLSQIVVFEGNPASGFFIPNDVLNSMAASNTVKNLGCSWGWTGGPSTTTETIFMTMSAQGQSFFNASGDGDAFTTGQVDNSSFTGSPSSSPNITQVGGTTLTMNGAGVSYASETVWNRGNGVGGSGGVSSFYSIPGWQTGASMLANGGSTTQRNIPDVALTAENVYVAYANNGAAAVGGTSCAAPLWAGFMALVNQQAVASGKPVVGFINPAIYEIANESIYNSTFHDITTGNNTSTTSPNAFYASPNYDLCTGIGTPNGTNLITALVNPDPLVVISNGGFSAVGTPAGAFNVSAQTFSVTNAGASSLSWSLINTSAWLNVSTSGGNLASGANNSVVVSLNTIASNLPAASYTATLWFSNVSSGVAHARLFSLVTSDPFVVSPTNGFNAIGTVAGTFSVSAQTFNLTNLGISTLNWSLMNTSAWLNVSSTSGTLGGGASAVVTASLNTMASNLTVGVYSATIVFTNVTTGDVFPRFFTLSVPDPLIILPTNNFSFAGLAGGPFSPATQGIILTNARSGALNWGIVNTSAWFSASASNGSLSAGGQTNITFTFTSIVTNLAVGTYPAIFQVTNLTSHSSQPVTGSVQVLQTLVQNGGFETGDLTGWSFTGTSGDNGLANNSSISGLGPHSGSIYWAFGEVSVQAFLAQTIPTVSGQLYLISLWFDSSANPTRPRKTTPNEFSVAWNGATIYDVLNVANVGWTNVQFVVSATGSSTLLNIGGRDDNFYLGLDDVSIVPGFVPSIVTQPTNLTALAGSSAVFTGAATGSTNLVYQWKKNGTNLVNGTGISGATASVLTLTGLTTNSAANYALTVTNIFGAATSSVAVLTVVLPPGITTSSLTNRTLECGGTISYAITASGNTPLFIQWSLDGAPVLGATNSSLSLTNIHLPSHVVAVALTNAYASFASNAVLTVNDTQGPVITLNGNSRMTNELGSAFIDPGATASDVCAGAVPVVTNGVVNTAVVGTNTLTYIASDGNGNTNTAVRVVVVRDTTPPTITYSFTNLSLSLDTNCSATMPDVTGTNFILATDPSVPLVITQLPTNSAALLFGTNMVVIAVADAYGNMAFSTNQIIVRDTALPLIISQPQGLTNFAGTTASFSVSATACTPLGYQWLLNGAALTVQTNSSLTLSNVTTGNNGNYSVAVTSSGGSITSAAAVLVVKASSGIALVSSANPDGFKASLTFTATVTPTNATGMVQFLTNGAAFGLQPLVAGMATSTNLLVLPRGTNLIAAIYSGDTTYLPATNTLAQIVTNHPPVVAPAFYSLIAGLNLNISVASLATNWSDADGDALAIAAISPSTNGVMVTNATPSLFYSDTNYVNDQFVVTVSDGFGGTNFQTVSIAVMPQTNTTPSIGGVAIGPSGLSLTLDGGYGSTYILQSATNFISGGWVPIATNTLGVTGVWRFTDTQVTNFPNRFYRLQRGP